MGTCASGRLQRVGTLTLPRKVEHEYEIGDIIGRGAFGVVNEGVRISTGQLVAIKRLPKVRSHPEFLVNELAVLEAIGQHDYIVDYVDHFEDAESLTIVFELMAGGELFDRLVRHGPYSEADAHRALVKVAHALAHCHSKSIIHRDLKPENLLLQSADEADSVKLADFGLSKLLRPTQQLTRVCGTWAYSAPEMANKQGYGLPYDMWSFGVIMFIVLSGFHPFDPEGDYPAAQVKALARQGLYSLQDPVWSNITDSAKDLVQKLLVLDPAERLTAPQLVAHPWMQPKVPHMTSKPINAHIDVDLKNFRLNMRKKLKMGMNATFAITSMRRLSSERKAREAAEARGFGENGGGSLPNSARSLRSGRSPLSARVLMKARSASLDAADMATSAPTLLTSLNSSKLVTIKSGLSFAEDESGNGSPKRTPKGPPAIVAVIEQPEHSTPTKQAPVSPGGEERSSVDAAATGTSIVSGLTVAAAGAGAGAGAGIVAGASAHGNDEGAGGGVTTAEGAGAGAGAGVGVGSVGAGGGAGGGAGACAEPASHSNAGSPGADVAEPDAALQLTASSEARRTSGQSLPSVATVSRDGGTTRASPHAKATTTTTIATAAGAVGAAAAEAGEAGESADS